MASFEIFAGMNTKYCYAGNLATRKPLMVLDGVMNASL
jgi:hypothetical protein